MFTPLLAHIAGVPVEETLLSVGPALVAAVSMGMVHIRSLRNPSSADEDDDDRAVPDGEDVPRPRRPCHAAGDPTDPTAVPPAEVRGREDELEQPVP